MLVVEMVKKITIADKILLLLLVLGTIATYYFVERMAGVGTTILVEVNGEPRYKADLSSPAEFSIQGTLGHLRIKVHEGRVAVIEADCPNHLCVRTGWRSRAGELIVCAPNRTVVRIVGEKIEGVRAVTG
jgi:hypothetical protein